VDGEYEVVRQQCDVLELTAEAGSVLFMSETLFHAGVPILSERTRYNMYCSFVLSWMSSVAPGVWGDWPQSFVDRLPDEELRQIFGPPSYPIQSVGRT
jgi:hypothetical protein